MSEIWDIYDETMHPTGRTFMMGYQRKPGEYAYMVHVILRNKQGKYLIQRRSMKKQFFPGMWDATCGKVQAGEIGAQAAVRETREELGLVIFPNELSLCYHGLYYDVVLDIFYACLDFDEASCTLQEDEVEEIRLLSPIEFYRALQPSKPDEYLQTLHNIFIKNGEITEAPQM